MPAHEEANTTATDRIPTGMATWAAGVDDGDGDDADDGHPVHTPPGKSADGGAGPGGVL